MNLIKIKVADCKQSPTNVGGRTEGKEFDELVDSIKAKGVLVPVLARMIDGKNKVGKVVEVYEVIAGNRRLAAAKKAGIEFIPAQVVKMTDAEAREAQIIENIQRQGIHPLDEGEQIRKLVEDEKIEMSHIAAHFGKSIDYIKGRVILSGLIEKAKTAFRKYEILDGHAKLIARLATTGQEKALQYCLSDSPTTKELKEFIDEDIYEPLKNQPWVTNKEINALIGVCKECPADENTLFPELTRHGRCTDTRCWRRKMDKYIELIIANVEKQKGIKLLKVSTEYGPAQKGILGRNDFEQIEKKKDVCSHATLAIVVQGEKSGAIIQICRDPKCKTHKGQYGQRALTPEEKKKRQAELKKEREVIEKKVAKEDSTFLEAMKKLKWPVSEKQLDIIAIARINAANEENLKPMARRHDMEVVIKNEKMYMSDKATKRKDWRATVIKHYEALEPKAKWKIFYEFLMEERLWEEPKSKVIKQL